MASRSAKRTWRCLTRAWKSGGSSSSPSRSWRPDLVLASGSTVLEALAGVQDQQVEPLARRGTERLP